MCFIFSLGMLFAGFCLGYYVSGHPDDTRSFLTRLKVSVTNLFHKKAP